MLAHIGSAASPAAPVVPDKVARFRWRRRSGTRRLDPSASAFVLAGMTAAWQPNLTFLTPQFAVGGSFPIGRAAQLAAHTGIRAVVDLRVEARDDAAELSACGLAFLHLPTHDLTAVSLAMLDEGVAFVQHYLALGGKVLVHCEHGIGRSATLALCVLVASGMAPLEALELAKRRRDVVSPSPAQYDAWVAWLAAHRAQAGRDWHIPPFDAFKAIAYRHLAGGGG